MFKYMLDTNIVIYVIKQRPPGLREIFNMYAGQMCISSITYAELIHGVEKSSLPERNRRNVEDFVSHLEIVGYDKTAAAHYGEIRADLKRKGRVMGVNDLHIAGHARSQGLVLVTNNTREFERVDGLRIADWTCAL
ncbi:type II toxin-antitoxin system tRNA(fMet)-specific endonuclease VapC [Spirochaeta dissipatitropha]